MNTRDPLFEFEQELQAIRRDIHAHPELCFEEHRTSALVAAKLEQWGIPTVRGLGGTGVLGIIKRGSSQKAIGLRADMDALPMQEINQFPHASQIAGKMHACGHDGHTAMLLGAAYQLSRLLHNHDIEKSFDGTIYLIFQPAEEGGGGARRMIEDGLFEKYPMDAVFGMHNWPGIPVGHFGVRTGGMMASSNEFEVTVIGKGAHAAQPHKGIDPVMIAVQIAQAWQTIVSRNINPVDPAVVSLTQIHSGSATNVIPDEASMIGTVRTFSTEVLDLIEKRMETIANSIATAFDATVNFKFKRNYPPLINHDKETAFTVEVMRELFGTDKVDANVEPTMGAEDFAYFLQAKPGCYLFIGNGDTGEHRSAGHGLGPCNLHNPSYDFNDALLPIGGKLWINLAMRFLKAS